MEQSQWSLKQKTGEDGWCTADTRVAPKGACSNRFRHEGWTGMELGQVSFNNS